MTRMLDALRQLETRTESFAPRGRPEVIDEPGPSVAAEFEPAPSDELAQSDELAPSDADISAGAVTLLMAPDGTAAEIESQPPAPVAVVEEVQQPAFPGRNELAELLAHPLANATEATADVARRPLAPLEAKAEQWLSYPSLAGQIGDLAQALTAEFAAVENAAILLIDADAGEHACLISVLLGRRLGEFHHGGALLVDGDFAHRRLTLGLGFDGCRGLSETLTRSEAGGPLPIHPTAISGLTLIPAGADVVLGNGELDLQVAKTIENLKFGRRWIVIHGAKPAVALTRSFARACDGVYLTVRLGQTSTQVAADAIAALQAAGGKVRGVIATNAPPGG